MAEHSTLTGANLHEPKGVAAATASQVYVSDGAASGVWTDTNSIEPAGAATATINQVYVSDGAASGAWTDPADIKTSYVVNTLITDVSTAETVYIPIPLAGTVTAVTSVLEGAITVADATLTASNSAAASMGTLTVAFTGSAAGDVDTLAPASNNVVTANDYITVATDGGSTTAQRVWVSIVIERS